MSLLTIIQNVMLECGLPPPATAFTSTDKSVRRIIALSTDEGQQLAGNYNWAALQTRGTITLVAAQQAYALPADFDRPINRTNYDQSSRWQMYGSLSPQEWSLINSGITTLAPPRRWRIFGSGAATFFVDPIPTAADAGSILTYEYISKNWCKSFGGTGQDKWVADDDLAILPERLLKLGAKWRFLATIGEAYEDDYNMYMEEAKSRFAQEVGSPVLNTDSTGLYSFFPYPNIPDGNFG